MNSELRRFAFATAVVLVAAAFGFGCGSDSDGGGRPSFLALYEGEPNGDDVGLRGTLVREGECLYAQSGDFRTLLLLPDSITRWEDVDGGTLVVADRRAALGGEVRLGGSELTDLDRVSWARRPDPSCPTHPNFLVGD